MRTLQKCILLLASLTLGSWRLQPQEVAVMGFDPLEAMLESEHQDAKFVYLTFDDGPSRNTNAILDILDEHDIQGTFFVLGTSVKNYSQSTSILQRMVEGGHYIGLHSMTHLVAYLYDAEEAAQHFLDEMMELREIVKSVTGGFDSTLCRAPYGTYQMFTEEHVRLIMDSDLNCWDWNVDTNDWRAESITDIMASIEEGMVLAIDANKAVVLLHESDIVVEALPEIISYYQERGYEFLTYHPEFHFPLNFIKSPDL